MKSSITSRPLLRASSQRRKSNLFRNLLALLVIPASAGLFLSAPPAKAQNAYITNSFGNSVSVIATATNTVTGSPISVGSGPVAFGLFIGPAPKFAGSPGTPDCNGKSVSALAKKYGGLDKAAQVLGYPSVQTLKNAIESFCGQ